MVTRFRRSDRAWRDAAMAVGALLLTALGCEPTTPVQKPDTPSVDSPSAVAAPRRITPEKAEEIEEFCGICHVTPRADYFPRHAWQAVAERAFGYWLETGRSDVKAPSLADVVAHYQSHAPERLEIAVPERSRQPFGARFERVDTDRVETRKLPAVSHVRWGRLAAGSPPVFTLCDMLQGEIRSFDPRGGEGSSRLLATAKTPCRSESVDLDGDGVLDLLVADLGRFLAQDHDEGQVLWLKGHANSGAFRPIPLHTKVGRVADAQAADFDGDGDLDVVVAEFGWHKTGSVYWLESLDWKSDPPRFRRHDVDPRPGAIHVPIVDLNGDGKPDFLALMSQDYEEVLAWINQGDGTFLRHVLSDRQEPSFGSSGIVPTDFDGDGDLDVLYTNGDTFDSKLAKPYHGLQWLENRGEMPFKLHRVADLIGAFRAAAADLDGDGDQDLVVGGFLPAGLVDPPPLAQHDSLVILEQTAPGRFARHSLARGEFHQTSFELGDFNDDGRPDIAAGRFHVESHDPRPRLTIWWNRGK